MKHIIIRNGLLALLFLLLLAGISGLATPITSLHAQSGGWYNLTWNSIDGGGYMASSGGAYVVTGTIGQPDAGTLSSTPYVLQGGFWKSALDDVSKFFLPLIRR